MSEHSEYLPEYWAEAGYEIDQRIDELGVTQAEFLRRTVGPDGKGGLSFKTLQRVLNGERLSRRDKRRDLARALEWPPNAFDLVDEGRNPKNFPLWDWENDRPATPRDAALASGDLTLERLAVAVSELRQVTEGHLSEIANQLATFGTQQAELLDVVVQLGELLRQQRSEP